jgi:hypothetical protein
MGDDEGTQTTATDARAVVVVVGGQGSAFGSATTEVRAKGLLHPPAYSVFIHLI